MKGSRDNWMAGEGGLEGGGVGGWQCQYNSTSDALQLLNKALKNAIAIAVAPMAHS